MYTVTTRVGSRHKEVFVKMLRDITWLTRLLLFGDNLRWSAASDNSFYYYETKCQKFKSFLKAKLRTMIHAREIVFQLPAMEFKLHKGFIFNVQR
jgi:hypothetical protein